MEPEIVQRFLESVGSKADIDLYLKLLRAQRKESFAIIAPNAQIVKTALDPFHFDLRILADLGLLPVVLLGLFEPKDADAQAPRVVRLAAARTWCRPARSSRRRRPAARDGRGDRARRSRAARSRWSRWRPPKALTDRRALRLLAALAAGARDAQARVPQPPARLGARRRGRPRWSTCRPTTERLLAPGALSRGQALLLRQVKQLLEMVPHRLSVTVVNPLQLLRELFTVNGAGTLIRAGSRIECTTAGRSTAPACARCSSRRSGAPSAPISSTRRIARAFVEESYRGAAVVAQTRGGALPDEVRRRAPGPGRGHRRRALVAGHARLPAFFWRSRPANPITAWYVKQCDGLARFPEWHVFWRGLPVETVEPAVRFALAAPSDFGQLTTQLRRAPHNLFVALGAHDVVERLAARDQGGAAVVPPHLRRAAERDVVRAHGGAVGAGVVQHQQSPSSGRRQRARVEQLLVVAGEDVAALAQRARDHERLGRAVRRLCRRSRCGGTSRTSPAGPDR